MSSVRKYANIPNLDHAPDIYETPELTDDNSTIPTSNDNRSSSPHSPHSDQNDGDGIIRQRIPQDQARTRFLSEDERSAISPTRIGERRRAHAALSANRIPEVDGILNSVPASTDQDREESVTRKLARLRREVLELQNEIERKGPDDGAASSGSTDKAETDKLVALLNEAETAQSKYQKNATTRLLDRVRFGSQAGASHESIKADAVNAPDAKSNVDDPAMFMVVKLDARLKDLEDLLGLDAIPIQGQEARPVKPLLPALDALDKQYTVLSTSTESSIEKVRDRVRELTNDASTLEMKRSQAKKALENLTSTQTRSRSKSGTLPDGAPRIDITDDHEQALKINALYGTLNTIDSVAPLLPSLLERLRSLRDLHANAADASQDLSDLEREQHEVQEELRLWKDGVERVEKAVSESQGTLKENTEVVEEWVQELEQRLKDLQSP